MDSAWVAQHHFDAEEGGLPAPLVFLAQAAMRTSRIALGTGIITLPLENPIRVAEDTAVLEILSGGRLQVGVGPGGNFSNFAAFGLDYADRSKIFEAHLRQLRSAWAGAALAEGSQLYPAAGNLCRKVWQATFSVSGGERAGKASDGLMLSRSQPRTEAQRGRPLHEVQQPIVDAYLSALPDRSQPQIMASRTVFVADDRRRRFISPG